MPRTLVSFNKCSYCLQGKTIRTESKVKLKPTFECEECDQVFATKMVYRAHIAKHERDKMVCALSVCLSVCLSLSLSLSFTHTYTHTHSLSHSGKYEQVFTKMVYRAHIANTRETRKFVLCLSVCLSVYLAFSCVEKLRNTPNFDLLFDC